MVTFGEGRLGTIVCDNGFRYDITWNDMLWLGRMLSGEAPRGTGRDEYAALLWCYTQRNARDRNGGGRRRTVTSSQFGTTTVGVPGENGGTISSFAMHVRLHSQPINPRWQRDGYFCRPGGPKHGTDRCSSGILDRRDQKAALQWSSITNDRQQALIDWARARLPNPIPGHVDFAAGPSPGRPQGWRPNRVVRNGPAPLYGGTRVTGRGNVFYKQHRGPQRKITTDWPANYVRIEFEESTSEEDESTNTEDSVSTTRETTTVTREARTESNVVREDEITSNRTSPPQTRRNYYTVEGRTEDPQALRVLSEDEEDSRILVNQNRFYNQVNSLKAASTLDMAQATPVIQILTQDEEGNIVNLNNLIFSRGPFSEIFEQGDDLALTLEFDSLPTRPIASIKGLTFKVETPSVGGPTGILIGNLSLKIHNPELVTSRHPRGKFISWMMRMGFYLRIRYGVNGPDTSSTTPDLDLDHAFQWKEQDFFVAQHNLNINDDKTYDLDLTIMPAAQKLLNQIHVGESIPFQRGETELTQEDIDRILEQITSDVDSQDQITEMRNRLERFRQEFNSGRASAGYRIREEEGENGTVTIGSVLHGAISQSQIIDQPEGRQVIPVENMVDGLRTIQSILLTRRFERVLEKNAWRQEIKGVDAVWVKMGPLFEDLIVPEFEQIVRYTAQNNLQIGEVFSIDEEPTRDPPVKRTSINLIFGKFNQKAGSWADRPISEFPINVNSIFGYLRQERNVGQFSSTINAFIGRLNSMMNEPRNFTVEREAAKEGEGERTRLRIERPQLKYLIYPDPADPKSWIVYVYDNKLPVVRFSEILGELSKSQNVSRQDIIDRLDELRIPWMEMGERGSTLKSMSARTVSDDRLMAHNMLRTNQNAITSRDIDGSPRIYPGMDAEFLNGAQGDPQDIIRATTLVLPIEVTTTSYMMTTANLFLPIYVFMPTKMFEGLYMPYVVEGEIRAGHVQTRMTLQINITQANRSSE